MDRKTALKVLGLLENSSEEEIKKVYKRLALKCHPDKNNSSDAKKMWHEINQAYDFLTEGDKNEPTKLEDYKCGECGKTDSGGDGWERGQNNRMFCSIECLQNWQLEREGRPKLCKICGADHTSDNRPIIAQKCAIALNVFSEINLLSNWNLFSPEEKKTYEAEIKNAISTGMIEESEEEVNKILKRIKIENEKIGTRINQAREQCAEKIKNLKDWNLLDKEAQEEIIEALKRCHISDQFDRQIKLAKDQIEKVRRKNPDIPDDDELNELISKAKKEKNWNNFPNLKKLLTQIKSLQTSDSYNEHKAEIRAIEERLKELNPENFKNSIEKGLEEKLKSNGLSKEELSPENQEKFQAAIASGDIEKKQEVEEIIIETGVKKELNETVTCVKKVLTDQNNLTKTQKEELLKKLEKFISGNAYQKKIYQKQKRKIDNLIIELRKEITNEQENSEFAWLEKIGIAAVISLGITILFSVAMRINAHRRRRNPQ